MDKYRIDRSDKIIQTFSSTRPLRDRLVELAHKRNVTVSALIREILEKFFEDREAI